MPKGVYQRKTEEQRFWEKVDVKGEDECWLWLGSKDPDGYGYFTLKSSGAMEQKGKTILAHRYSLMLKLNVNELDSKTFACHSCDEKYDETDKTYRCCVNPNHLYPDTAGGNSKRMVELNRTLCGERNHQTTITEEQAKEILDTYTIDKQNGRLYGSLERLAEKYNQSKQSIYRLVSGKTWKHLSRL